MCAPYIQLYLHLVWATRDRLPLIDDEIKGRLYAAIAEKCRELECAPLAIGGVADHVHLLVRLHSAVAVVTLVEEVKRSSSHLVIDEIRPGRSFKWQDAYGALTLSKDEALVIQSYIEGQQRYHSVGLLREEWERTVQPGDSDSAGAGLSCLEAKGPAQNREQETS